MEINLDARSLDQLVKVNFNPAINVLITYYKTGKMSEMDHLAMIIYRASLEDNYLPHPLRAGECYEPLANIIMDLQNEWENDSIVSWLENLIKPQTFMVGR